jgi:uncharacterized protein YcgI (DUF1989 family)
MRSLDISAQSGARLRLNAGQELRIVDVEGCQVADLFAVCAADLSEHLSASTTRGPNHALFPPVGGVLLSTSYRPMLTFVRDDSPGFHDAQFAACSPEMYQALSFEGYHPSCAENLLHAAAEIGWNPSTVPDPFNFFQRVSIDEDGRLSTLSAATAPGDSVTLRAECDVHVIVTACSMDLANINGASCTGLRLEVS